MRKISISDDDLCSNCEHCKYDPGQLSSCELNFNPAIFNPDGYVIDCFDFKHIEKQGDNWVNNAVNELLNY